MPECKSAKRDMRRRVARTRGSLGQERSRGWKGERRRGGRWWVEDGSAYQGLEGE